MQATCIIVQGVAARPGKTLPFEQQEKSVETKVLWAHILEVDLTELPVLRWRKEVPS